MNPFRKMLAPAVQIRWMLRRDQPAVQAIEQASFEFPWTEEDFLTCLRQRNCVGMVASIYDAAGAETIVGFFVYALYTDSLRILSMAAAPEARRQGVGRRMVAWMIDKLIQHNRSTITAEVRERNLDAQLFFQRLGFRAVQLVPDHYEDTAEAAIVMEYVLPGAKDPVMPKFAGKNRITKFLKPGS